MILAGGRGSRMGGAVPKPLVELAGRPLIAYVIDRLSAQAGPLILAAPRGVGFERFGLDLAPDRRPDLPGPLAGIEAGLEAAAHRLPAGPAYLLVTPGDTPFLPADLAARLAAPAAQTPVIVRFSGVRQPAVGLWPVAVLPALTAWLDDGRPLAIRAFLDTIGHQEVAIPASPSAPGGDPFFNVNSPGELALAERFLDAAGGR
ncbi:NTP transferase domain-containing protein [Jiella sonneratiae]|uniref:Molybdenum cofactor guanylyltransferase n=1 Tax=Jiella sonneratiae TaxID=2816856 RepID=A0ABS3J0J4_9HYPH|nr:NTP transferase domain-containing protein [Jiella sonneratiae]